MYDKELQEILDKIKKYAPNAEIGRASCRERV